jgi:choice-of-anchor B domain-containing protein
MKYLILTLIVTLLSITSFSQLNTILLSQVNYQQLHQANLNDVWGYVDETGKEYAIVGTTEGTSILDVSDPMSPTEIFWIAGSSSIWRDPCVHGDYAYVTTEANDGLLIIDLSPLPSSSVLPTSTYFGTTTPQLLSAHTCFVDENGFAYVFGSNRGNGGALILDVQTNPMQPTEVGFYDNWYVHDGFVRNDTMFLAHISDGFVSLVDVSDKANPILLGTKNTPNNFSHNIWPSDDGQTVYTTDEVSGAFLTAYNISDPQNIVEIDRIQNSPGQGVIPHNAHVRGNYLISSYYSDGIVVHDITYPDNMVKVAEFDTYPTQTSGFDGCWGVYPFLPSGNLLASDITEGLFIIGVNYQQASYLEGMVTDASTLAAIQGVSIQIIADDQVELSRVDGSYKTGILATGTYDVIYSKVGYYSQTLSVQLVQGQIVIQNVQLIPIPPFQLTINVYDASTSLPIADALIQMKVPLLEQQGITNGLGQEQMTLYYQEQYDVSVVKWGYFPSCFNQVVDQNTGVLNIYLEKGYHDEFTFDLGWIVGGNATTGMWERGIPNSTSSGSAPGNDAEFDCTDKAYITGNDATLNPDLDDVDGGVTLLTSPSMDLSSYTDPYLNFSYWFYCFHGNTPDDTLKIVVTNGFTAVVIAKLPAYENLFYQWVPMSIRLSDYIAPSATMQVVFRVSDNDPNVNITEAGIDYFYISNSNVLDVNSSAMEEGVIYPNPTSGNLTVKSAVSIVDFELLDLNGKVVLSGISHKSEMELDISALKSGFYIFKSTDFNSKVLKD